MALFSRKPFKVYPIGMHWDTEDPFLFVSHHEDDYPEGNRQQAPPLQQISGRNLGRDYQVRFGFRMYNGKVVPGFPMHAHWGYETITLAEKGYVDHFDTEGIEGRFGFGDVQWVCASSKYQHDEMYPLADQEARNPNDITQIHLNLPLEMKNKANAVSTVWACDVPVVEGEGWSAKVICGTFGGRRAASPSPESWADGTHGVRILRFAVDPGASFELDPAAEGARRNVYLVTGDGFKVAGLDVKPSSRVKTESAGSLVVENSGTVPAVVWVLEGRPIGQEMSAWGPVTLGNIDEVRRAMDDIRKDEYQVWPWKVVDLWQPLGTPRFIRQADGTVSVPSDQPPCGELPVGEKNPNREETKE